MTYSQSITYIGHATVLVEMDGVRVLTDPVLRDWVWHLRRSKTPLERAWTEDIDAVLISHTHWDHLDLGSLRLLDPEPLFVVPRGSARILRRKGFRRVEEIEVGQAIPLGAITLRATYAEHSNGRLRHRDTTGCLGYVMGGTHSVYFAGDTDLFPDMAGLADDLDVALLPVWGWGPTVGSGHMNPYRAAVAAQMLAPRAVIPIHWGTLYPFMFEWFFPEHLHEPPNAFAEFAADLAPNVRPFILPPGAHISVPALLDGIPASQHRES